MISYKLLSRSESQYNPKKIQFSFLGKDCVGTEVGAPDGDTDKVCENKYK